MLNTTNLQLKKPTDTDNADLTIFVGNNMDKIDTVIGNNNSLSTTSKEVVGAINELFQSASNGKDSIATAITGKGVQAYNTDSFNTLANKINQISNSSEIEITKLNVSASVSTPYTKNILLNNTIQNFKISYNIREFVGTDDLTSLVCTFSNGDSSSFYSNSNIIFDGDMKLTNKTTTNLMTDGGALGSGNLYSYTVDKTLFNSVDTITYSEIANQSNISIFGTNFPTSIIANNDVDLTGVEKLSKILFNSTISNGGKCLLAISVDSGVTYKAYNGASWITVNVNNMSDFSTKGMTETISDALTSVELQSLRGSSDKIRFAYYLSVTNLNSVAKIQDISLTVNMYGHYVLATKTDYDVLIGADNRSFDFKIYKNGTYTMNVTNN